MKALIALAFVIASPSAFAWDLGDGNYRDFYSTLNQNDTVVTVERSGPLTVQTKANARLGISCTQRRYDAGMKNIPPASHKITCLRTSAAVSPAPASVRAPAAF